VVELTATVTRGRELGFGFFKRPSKVRIVRL
jgi:hypothetical protein